MSRASIFVPSRDGASRLSFAFLLGTSTAPASVIVDRSNSPTWGAFTVPVNVPVSSKVFTPASDSTDLVRISFGSVRADAWGVDEHAARTADSTAMSARSEPRMGRRNTGTPWRGLVPDSVTGGPATCQTPDGRVAVPTSAFAGG